MYPSDISDIPLTRSIPDPSFGTVVADDTEDILKELADDSPLEQQLAFARAGGILAPKSDRTETGGIPLNMPPDKVGGQQVRLVGLGDDGSERLLANYAVDSMGDPVVREVMAKYALKDGESRTAAEVKKILISSMREIQEIKSARARQSRNEIPASQTVRKNIQQGGTQQGATKMAGNSRADRVDVVFEFGGVDGSRRARYADAYVEGNLLVLVADEALLNSGVYEPPDLGPNAHFKITLSTHPEPLTVMSIGLRHGYAGNMFYLLFLDN